MVNKSVFLHPPTPFSLLHTLGLRSIAISHFFFQKQTGGSRGGIFVNKGWGGTYAIQTISEGI